MTNGPNYPNGQEFVTSSQLRPLFDGFRDVALLARHFGRNDILPDETLAGHETYIFSPAGIKGLLSKFDIASFSIQYTPFYLLEGIPTDNRVTIHLKEHSGIEYDYDLTENIATEIVDGEVRIGFGEVNEATVDTLSDELSDEEKNEIIEAIVSGRELKTPLTGAVMKFMIRTYQNLEFDIGQKLSPEDALRLKGILSEVEVN